MSDRVILAVQYTAASGGGALRRAVSGFLRYVQYRDKHNDPGPVQRSGDARVSGLLKYVAYRDRSAPRGLLFAANGPAGDGERRDLASFVARAVAATRPQPSPAESPGARDRRRAVYRMVISPENATGLDLRELTRATMQQLATDAGGARLEWIAAEHRNTAHPHVHVVLAGFTEQADGRFRGLVINRARLQRMKDVLAADIARQRGVESEQASSVEAPRRAHSARRSTTARTPIRVAQLWQPTRPAFARHRTGGHPVGRVRVAAALRRAASRYRAESEREARAAERERGWER